MTVEIDVNMQYALGDDPMVLLTIEAGEIASAIHGRRELKIKLEVDTDPPPGEGPLEDQDRAELIAAAVRRLVTADSSIGASEFFREFRVGRFTDDGAPLAPLALELIAASLSEFGTVQFIDDAAAETAALFGEEPSGVAVVAVDRVDLLDDRAEVELWLWCGSLCGVWLTYEAIPGAAGWEIVGTTGPIAVA